MEFKSLHFQSVACPRMRTLVLQTMDFQSIVADLLRDRQKTKIMIKSEASAERSITCVDADRSADASPRSMICMILIFYRLVLKGIFLGLKTRGTCALNKSLKLTAFAPSAA